MPIVIGALGTITKGLLKGGLGSWQTGRNYPNDSIAKNNQNPETSPGDLKRLAVTQTPMKNHQMWKTLSKNFHITLYPWERYESNYSPSSYR